MDCVVLRSLLVWNWWKIFDSAESPHIRETSKNLQLKSKENDQKKGKPDGLQFIFHSVWRLSMCSFVKKRRV